MNKSVTYLIVSAMLAAGVPVTSCSDGGNDTPRIEGDEATIKITPESIDADVAASSYTISVTSDADWSITSDQTWCKVFPSGGLKGSTVDVNVTVEGNNTQNTRLGTLTITSGKTIKTVAVRQKCDTYIQAAATVNLGAPESAAEITVNSNVDWVATVADAGWCTVTPSAGKAGEQTLVIKCQANTGNADRTATVVIEGDGARATVRVIQLTDDITAPQGYTLVWNDEFNMADGSQPDLDKWWYEDWAPGYVNNELQRYVAGGKLGNEKTAEIKGGILNITAKKVNGQVISARLNTKELWQYGYFEARLKLPVGRGTWPAFWMMPANGGDWPHCGEIDIMEEVGTNPNYTSSSIHCTAYNHTIGTQKTAERYTAGAEDEFHIYALEWTPDYIRTYVDGKLLFSFANDGKGDENTWPFNKPFHPILNLAWGGDWGGMNGVDENALPATYQIDYVRVFQKL